MKKIFLCLALTLFISELSYSQSFSSALGGSGLTTSHQVIKSGQGVRSGSIRKPVTRKKTVIRYEPNQVELTDAQMEKLMPMIRRIQAGKTKSLEVVGIAKDYSLIYHRQTSLGRMFQSYIPNLLPRFREISGAAVVKANNNTVEFIEYQ